MYHPHWTIETNEQQQKKAKIDLFHVSRNEIFFSDRLLLITCHSINLSPGILERQ